MLYSWTTSMTRDVCPAGWHLPSSAEWEELVTFAGGFSTAGRKLKAKSGWSNNGNGTDDYGFSALPGGAWYDDNIGYGSGAYVGFSDVGDFGLWWTATTITTMDNPVARCYWYMNYDDDWSMRDDCAPGTHRFSVRCVAN